MLLSANVVLYAAPESGADRATVGAALSDTAITAQAMAKLHTGDRLHGSNVSAKTNDAVVTLSATAASSSAKEAAETLAANVSGVRMVNNQLIAASTALDLSSKARQATHRTAIAIEGTAITADLKIRGSLRSIAPRWARGPVTAVAAPVDVDRRALAWRSSVAAGTYAAASKIA